MIKESQFAWSTPSSTGFTDDDLKKAVNEIKKNAKGIYKLAEDNIKKYQKELDKIAIDLEKGIKNKGITGQVINAIAAKPIITFIKSLVSLDPSEVVEQLVDNAIFNLYDVVDNFNLIPEGDRYLKMISNFYDWVQVFHDVKPFIEGKDRDPYHVIEAATDLLYALKELSIAGQMPSLDVFNASLMSAYLMSKVAAPVTRYYADPKSGLKILGIQPKSNKNKVTEYFEDYQKQVETEINQAIIEGKTKGPEILEKIGKIFPWVNSFSNKTDLSANEMYLMEHTRDIIIRKQKIYSTILRIFNTFKDGQRWPLVKAQLNWETLSQNDKTFVYQIIEQMKRTNL